MSLSPDMVALGAMTAWVLSFACVMLANRAERNANAGGVMVFAACAGVLGILGLWLLVSGLTEIYGGRF